MNLIKYISKDPEEERRAKEEERAWHVISTWFEEYVDMDRLTFDIHMARGSGKSEMNRRMVDNYFSMSVARAESDLSDRERELAQQRRRSRAAAGIGRGRGHQIHWFGDY